MNSQQRRKLMSALMSTISVEVRLEFPTSDRAQDWTERLREVGIESARRDGAFVFIQRVEFEAIRSSGVA